MTTETITISGSGKVTTYNWMVKNARLSLEAAKASEEGQFFNAMNVLVYSAFAMEAFFNHLGSHLVENWESKERNLSKYKKLRKFPKDLGIDADMETDPYRGVRDAFDFRDSLAHGRTETVEKTETIELGPDETRSYMIGSEWMNFCTVENAERIFSSTEQVITELYQAAGLGDYPFLHYHSSVHSRA